RYSLPHERILITADEEDFFRQGIGTDLHGKALRDLIDRGSDTRVLGAKRHDVAEVIMEADSVNVEISRDLRNGYRGIVCVVIRSQQSLFLSGHDQEQNRTARSFGQFTKDMCQRQYRRRS